MPRPPRARSPLTWDQAISTLLAREASRIVDPIALRTGLLLLLRAHALEARSPRELTTAQVRTFLAVVPPRLLPEARVVIRDLRAIARKNEVSR